HALNGSPQLPNFSDWFLAAANAVESKDKPGFEGRGLAIACCRRVVRCLPRGPLQILGELRQREPGEPRRRRLPPGNLAAPPLDWQVDSYLHAVSDFEAAVDRLVVSVLSSRVYHGCLPELARLRRAASRLRRMLAPRRHVYGALARPDFRPGGSDDDEQDPIPAFRTLEKRFERAMDAVENARDLVVGSFELFASRNAQRTNATM